MTVTESKSHYLEGLVSLYHLLITADGHIDDKEVKMGEVMKKSENIDDWEFKFYLSKIKEERKEIVINNCIESLSKCDQDLRVRCIAWLSLIANSDGFMDPEEWKLIYYIYNTALKLNLTDILEMQKSLPRPI